MKTYGHLRDQHSTTMAQKVVFTETAPNVVPLPVADAAVQASRVNASNEAEKKSVGQVKAKYGYAHKHPFICATTSIGCVNRMVHLVFVFLQPVLPE